MSLLLVVLLACGEDPSTPVEAGSEASTPTEAAAPTQASPAEAEPAVDTTAAAEPESAVDTTAAAEAEAVVPCGAAEVWWHATCGDRREVFLCGSEAGLQYRFGPAAAPELVYPEQPDGKVFAYEEKHFVRSMGETLTFSVKDHTYEVAEMIGSGHAGEGAHNNFVGVIVRHRGNELARISCKADEEVAQWPKIRAAAAQAR